MGKGLLCILMLLALLTGCTGEKEASFTLNGNETLVRVEYDVVNPMMRCEDFYIDVMPEKINSSRIFAERDLEYVTAEDAAVTASQWQAINDAVMAIAPLLEETPEKKNNTVSSPLILDGASTSSFYLTWKTPDGETRVCYQVPSDRRFLTLVDILHETADPIGREITYYDAPVLTGIYFRRESLLAFNCYSYQCSLKKDSSDERYLYARYYDGEAKSYSTTVYADTWEIIEDKCMELGIDELETEKSAKKTFCTLYFSDQTQRDVILDSGAEQEMKALFDQIIAGLKEKSR